MHIETVADFRELVNKTLFLVVPCILLATVGVARASCPTWTTTDRFTINGAEVIDKRSGLIWARCSLGQNWNGSTCSGNALSLSHEAVLRETTAQSGWRLPSVKELSFLADKGCRNPAIDITAFPNTPVAFYWTASPYTVESGYAWGVGFGDGYFGISLRSQIYSVRLVRDVQ